MAGENTILSVKGYGRQSVVLTKISFGLAMNVSDTDMSRNGRMFKTYKVTSGTMTVDLVFNSHARHEAFMKWLQGHVRRSANPELSIQPIRILCPVRDIDKLAFLKSGITFGDKAGQASYPAQLAFSMVSDKSMLGERDRSIFQLPESDDPALPYLYPAGSQLFGGATGRDVEREFDGVPDIETGNAQPLRPV